jgi:hypothetical protein
MRVISGGQTGVDRIGLQAAVAMGLETGGTAPKGYMTDEEIDPDPADDLLCFAVVLDRVGEVADSPRRWLMGVVHDGALFEGQSAIVGQETAFANV